MQVRVSEERHPSPSAAICDAQSVKVGNPRCQSIGFDGGKLIKGRKRHLLVDTLGLVLMVIVTAANISDPRWAKILFWKARRRGVSTSRPNNSSKLMNPTQFAHQLLCLMVIRGYR
jgi:hypothetical protein